MPKERRTPMGKAWVDGFRLIFDVRQIKRGRRKGQFECYVFTGSGYRKIYVKEYKSVEGEKNA
jgi:hypothetical protein